MRREFLTQGPVNHTDRPTNSNHFITFLMESKLNIVLHDAPTPRIAVGDWLVEWVLTATLLFEIDRLPNFPCHSGTAIDLIGENAQKVTGVADARGEVLFEDGHPLAVDRRRRRTGRKKRVQWNSSSQSSRRQ